MSTLADLQSALSAYSTKVLADFQAISDKLDVVVVLVSKLEAGNPTDQATIDALNASLSDLSTATDTASAAVQAKEDAIK